MYRIFVHIISGLCPTKNLRKRLRERLFRAKNVSVSGYNNKIILMTKTGEKEVEKIKGFTLNIQGNNNTIRIPENHHIRGHFDIKSNNVLIDIKSQGKLNLFVSTLFDDGQKLVIGEKTIIYGADVFLHEKDASVYIGKGCLFSLNIRIWATDGHVILDNRTNKILNPITHPIIIGDHCWCGNSVLMTKNAGLACNSIIGGGSVVTKTFTQENILIAGNPAKTIKENVKWQHETPAELRKK